MVPAANMLPEVAYVKLGWALGQSHDFDEVRRLMLTPVNGETTDREPHNGYLLFQGGFRKSTNSSPPTGSRERERPCGEVLGPAALRSSPQGLSLSQQGARAKGKGTASISSQGEESMLE